MPGNVILTGTTAVPGADEPQFNFNMPDHNQKELSNLRTHPVVHINGAKCCQFYQ